jgi:uncharacterized protein (UPF0335 family)
MARKAKPGDSPTHGVTNLTETKEQVRASVRRIIQLREQQKDLRDEMNVERKKCKTLGIPPAALNLAIRMRDADPEDRQRHDEGYAIAREALGLKFQLSLFEDLDSREKSEETARQGKAAKAPKPKAAPATPPPADDSDLAGGDDDKAVSPPPYDPDFDDDPTSATAH